MHNPVGRTSQERPQDNNIMKERVKAVAGICGWILSYFIYLVVGAFFYVLLEEANDVKLKKDSRERLLSLLASYNISSNDTAIVAIIQAAVKAHDLGGLDTEDLTQETVSSWNLASAVFFASSIVTTIGYGNIAPVTYGGKTFTIFYALIGIPLTGVVLAKIGVGLSNVIKRADDFIGDRIRQCFPRLSKQDNMKQYIRMVQIVLVVIFFILFFWIVPAALMTLTDDMETTDAIYFCFISITTIGLGDIVPGVSNQGVPNQLSTEAIHAATLQVLTILYFLLGLSALTIMLSLIGSLIKTLADSTIKHGKDTIKNATMVAGAGARMFEGVGRSGQRMAQNMRRSIVNRESSLERKHGLKSESHASDESVSGTIIAEGDESIDESANNRENSGSSCDVRLILERQRNPQVVVTEMQDDSGVTHFNSSYSNSNQLPSPVE